MIKAESTFIEMSSRDQAQNISAGGISSKNKEEEKEQKIEFIPIIGTEDKNEKSFEENKEVSQESPKVVQDTNKETKDDKDAIISRENPNKVSAIHLSNDDYDLDFESENSKIIDQNTPEKEKKEDSIVKEKESIMKMKKEMEIIEKDARVCIVQDNGQDDKEDPKEEAFTDKKLEKDGAQDDGLEQSENEKKEIKEVENDIKLESNDEITKSEIKQRENEKVNHAEEIKNENSKEENTKKIENKENLATTPPNLNNTNSNPTPQPTHIDPSIPSPKPSPILLKSEKEAAVNAGQSLDSK